MSDLDQLRPAFEHLRGDVLPAIHPPGVAAARRTLRRRRRRNRAAAGIAAAVVAVVALMGLALRRPAPTAPAVGATSDSPVVEVPVPSRPVDSGPSATPSAHPAAPPPSSAGASGKPPAVRPTPGSTCQPQGIVDPVDVSQDNWVTASARVDGRYPGQLCPGERVRVFWVSYTLDQDGTLHLYRSAEYFVDGDHPTVRFQVELPPSCPNAFWAVYGNAPVRTTVPPGPDPYPDKWLARDTYSVCPTG